MKGDFILECIIQLEGGVKKRSAVKVPVVGSSAGGYRIRLRKKERKKGRRREESGRDGAMGGKERKGGGGRGDGEGAA